MVLPGTAGPSMRALRLVPLLLVLAAALPGALAQEPLRLRVEPETPFGSVEAGQPALLNVSVLNPTSRALRVTLAASERDPLDPARPLRPAVFPLTEGPVDPGERARFEVRVATGPGDEGFHVLDLAASSPDDAGLANATSVRLAVRAASDEDGPRLRLEPETDAREVQAGETALFNVSVGNPTDRPLRVRLDAAAPLLWSDAWPPNATVVPATEILVEPRRQAWFEVRVPTREGDFRLQMVRLVATSPDDASLGNSTLLRVTTHPRPILVDVPEPLVPTIPLLNLTPFPERGPTGVLDFRATLHTPNVTLHAPGLMLGIMVEVENLGDAATLVVRLDDPSGQVRLAQPGATYPLQPTGHGPWMLSLRNLLTFPLDAGDAEPGTYPVRLNLSLQEAPGVAHDLPVDVLVLPRPQLPDLGPVRDLRLELADPGPVRVAPGATVHVEATLANNGNRSYALAMEDGRVHRNASGEPDPEQAPGWTAAWERATLEIAPGQRVALRLALTAPANATVGDAYLLGYWALANGTATGMPVGVGGHADVLVVEPEPGAGAQEGDATLRVMSAVTQVHPLAWGGIGMGAGALVLARLLRRDAWRYAALAAVAPLYTRLSRGGVLEHEAREELHRLITAHPGIHYSGLKERTGTNAGALVHHLRTLERHGLVVSRREGPLRRFYAVGAAPIPAPPAIPTTPVQDRVLALLDEAPLTQKELAERLGLTQQGVSYHVKTLERKGLLVVRDGRARRVRPFLVER